MHDMAAQYLGAHVPDLQQCRSADALEAFLLTRGNTLKADTSNTDAFRELAARFGDDEGVVVSKRSGAVAPVGPESLPLWEQLSRISDLVATTFACARETVGTSIPIGWDPILYDRNSFLHKWLFSHATAIGGNNAVSNESQYEQTAVTAMVGDDLNFLEAIDIEDIRHVRQTAFHRDIRKALALSRDAFKVAARRSPEEALREFIANFRDAIQRFGAEYKDLASRQKSARWKSGLSFAGATSLAAMTFAFPASAILSGLAAGVGVLIGSKSALDLIALEKDNARKKRQMENNPLMLLYRATLASGS